MIKSDAVVAWLRTAVPVLWGALLTFLLSRFPAVHEFLSGPTVTMVVTGLVVTAWYSLWKWLESQLPAWLRTFLLGYDRRPSYFTGELTDAAWDNGYQAGQDDAVQPVSQADPAAWDAHMHDRAHHRQTDPPRSIARPGEDSGPRALTDVMPAVGTEDPPGDSSSEESTAETTERERRERDW